MKTQAYGDGQGLSKEQGEIQWRSSLISKCRCRPEYSRHPHETALHYQRRLQLAVGAFVAIMLLVSLAAVWIIFAKCRGLL